MDFFLLFFNTKILHYFHSITELFVRFIHFDLRLGCHLQKYENLMLALHMRNVVCH